MPIDSTKPLESELARTLAGYLRETRTSVNTFESDVDALKISVDALLAGGIYVDFTSASLEFAAASIGAQTFTGPAGVHYFTVGNAIKMKSSADSTKYLFGYITSYSSVTGIMVVNVTAYSNYPLSYEDTWTAAILGDVITGVIGAGALHVLTIGDSPFTISETYVTLVRSGSGAAPIVIVPSTGTILGESSYSLYVDGESVSLIKPSNTTDWLAI